MRKIILIMAFLLSIVWSSSAQITQYDTPQYNGNFPANCSPTSKTTALFYKFGASNGLYYCSAQNTWTRVGASVATGGTIGSATTGGTSGSVLYVDASGNLGQSNSNFFWNNTSATLKLRDKNYTTTSGGWNADQSSLQIADSSPRIINSTNGTYGLFIDLKRGQDIAGASQTSGIRVRANSSKTAGTGYTTAMESFIGNIGDTTAAGNFQAVEGIGQLTESATYLEGGGFATIGLAPTTTSAIPEVNGVRTYGGFPANWTIGDYSLYKGFVSNGASTITTLNGLKLDNWTNTGTVTNANGIYLGPTVASFGTNRYAIKSDTVAQSVFAGVVKVPINPYSRPGWINSQNAVTEDAVNQINNQDRQVTFFNDLFNNSNDDGGFTVQASVAGVFNNTLVSDFSTYNAVGLLNVYLKTGTTTKGWIAHPVAVSNLLVASYPLGTGSVVATFRFATVTASDATNTYTVRAGVQSHTQQEPDNGCFFRQTNAVNSGLYEAVCRNATTETAVNTTIATSATMKKYEVRINSTGTSATFYIEDVLVATITTNIPVASNKLVGACWSLQKSAGTTDIIAVVADYVKEVYTFTTSR